MKKFNGDKYLNNIKKKFNSKKELTIHDCAIIEYIPNMKNSKDTAIVVEELCNIIKNGIISQENRITLQATMWLNIDYYIENQEKREELMGMIDVVKSQESEFFKWQEEFGKFKEEQGKKEIISKLLNYMDPKEISDKTGISLDMINEIANK